MGVVPRLHLSGHRDRQLITAMAYKPLFFLAGQLLHGCACRCSCADLPCEEVLHRANHISLLNAVQQTFCVACSGPGSRLAQIVEWCGGEAFDGALVLDECHVCFCPLLLHLQFCQASRPCAVCFPRTPAS